MTTKKRLLLVLISVALLSMGWLGLSGLSLLVALVPLLIISEHYSDSTRDWWRMCGWGAMTFLLWQAATVWWVWNATPIGPVASAVVGSFWNLVPLMVYHYASKRAPRGLAYTLFVALWIASEYIYNSAEVMTFPWLLLGHGFSNDIWAVQWYEYTGLFGGTLWVLASNVAIFEILRSKTKVAKVRAALIALVPMLLSIVLYFSYKPSEREAVISVIQPNVPCYEEQRQERGTRNDVAAIRALCDQVPASASYVLLPESALSYVEGIGSLDEGSLYLFAPDFVDMFGQNMGSAKLITGASTVRNYGNNPATETARQYRNGNYYDYFNSALLVGADGNVEKIYHKGRLVIGVEAVPMRKLFKLFEVDLGGISGQLGWGREHLVFENQGVKIGPSICYEGIYGDYFAGFARNGAEVMALISNDGWWGDTPGHRRLFDFARLRAIETRRAIARSANTGISGFISPRGETIGERLEWDERGVLTANVELRDDVTIYTRYGDWVARIASYVAVLAAMYYVAYRVRRRNHLVD
jgi:apolipoprotein N-acyltransferase